MQIQNLKLRDVLRVQLPKSDAKTRYHSVQPHQKLQLMSPSLNLALQSSNLDKHHLKCTESVAKRPQQL